ncbi:MAG: glutamate synthase-related protein [Desulfurivibrionaceae bacterium]|jgi:glutamate synthase domain-containing protein 2|nr:FMN-binding glutamate synthase family protein [Pseudomonadota bacterium]MCG2822636.1 glutamate synthase-related protein [Desulfobulbaceae bacterium]MDP2003629.1 glutamate synthase-related protein [Desulfurivibrionaceae bacterium]PKN22328.1 MAG: FMN-binding glutamate synthase family protein [Deltaproteobacteria bacterium HGW-Deltaproteobacteria-3]MBU4407561.1 FMN-binding glutamate synthase family protein [Pseudomonadota bacterium]
MTFSKPNRSAATLTTTRVNPAPTSGICVTCLDGCRGPCEIGKSAIKGREMLYPAPFGKTTSGSEKDYPVDFSHFNIQGTAVGAVGVAADPDFATFPAVDTATYLGADGSIKLQFPVFTGAVGSTEIARVNWDEIAVGAAISGVIVVAGENICGMDPQAEFAKGHIVKSPEMERRIAAFRQWYDGTGGIIIQANVEDTKLKVPEYVIEKLGIEIFELKWGQGAKDIGGEVKLHSIERALQLKERGYIVLPDPTNPAVAKAFNVGAITEFERHSRLGMVTEESFHSSVAHLRSVGAKYVTLKTGAYRPADLARAIKYASDAKIDLLTIDGAGGGTGMSPWRMMNEWGIPTVQLECLAHQMCERLAARGAYIPPIAIAGGLSLEDHVHKALALGAPYVKAVCLGRAMLTAAMVGKTHGRIMREKMETEEENVSDGYMKLFAVAAELREKYGKDFDKLPAGAIGMYSYIDRMKQGLQQFMAGSRKFALKYIERNDLVALTRDAADVSGIPYVMDSDREEVDRILG